jgi:transcriptional regulator with XRE-family HTH domain
LLVMDAASQKRLGRRIAGARRRADLTQQELAALLGITTRSLQNYESGAIVPYRHLAHIETATRVRRGWLLETGSGEGGLDEALAATADNLRAEGARLRANLDELRAQTEQLRERKRGRA